MRHNRAHGAGAFTSGGSADFRFGDEKAKRLEFAERGDEHRQTKNHCCQPEGAPEHFIAQPKPQQPFRLSLSDEHGNREHRSDQRSVKSHLPEPAPGESARGVGFALRSELSNPGGVDVEIVDDGARRGTVEPLLHAVGAFDQVRREQRGDR